MNPFNMFLMFFTKERNGTLEDKDISIKLLILHHTRRSKKDSCDCENKTKRLVGAKDQPSESLSCNAVTSSADIARIKLSNLILPPTVGASYP